MKKRFLTAFGLSATLVFCLQAISGQVDTTPADREAAAAAAGDKYVISAKAGGVNYVEGSVSIVRKDGRSGYLTRRDEVQIGDVVSTAADSRAEFLLNPGSFLRLGPNSSFEFTTTSLDDLRIGLKSGTAIFEVFASPEFKVRVTTPKAKLLLIRSGVFRIDVLNDGGLNISVFSGQSLLGDKNSTLLRAGNSATLSGGVASVEKIDRRKPDEFEAWSKSRGKELAKRSAALKNSSLKNPLMMSFNRGGWGMFGSFGVWVYDPFYGGFCFLPFGEDWMSPYGFWYHNCMCRYNLPPVIYVPPTGVGGGGGGGPIYPGTTPIARQGDRSPTPPFVRMAGSGGAGVGGNGRGITDTSGGGFPNHGGGSGGGGGGDTRSTPPIIRTPPMDSGGSSSPPPETKHPTKQPGQ